jgi:hypothetical protein
VAVTVGLGLASWTAQASPGLDGTRNLAMGNSTRGSSAGSNAMLINPAGLSYTQQFSIDAMYQAAMRDRTHGLGVFLSDSLNNPRFAIGLGYVFMKGAPRVRYTDANGERRNLSLSHFGHEALGVISVAAVRNWFYLALKPKYQYTSLRYLDDDEKAKDARKKLNAFGIDAAIAVNFLGFAKLAVVGTNFTGNIEPAWTEDDPIELENVAQAEPEPGEDPEPVGLDNVRRVSDYPLGVAHGLAVFPLKRPDFSLNFDGTYDFTSYWKQDKHVRLTYGGSIEYVLRGVPLRVGGYWDGRGKPKEDDRGYVTFGTGYIRSANAGGVGFEIGVSVSQQVAGPGPRLDTMIGGTLGIRLNPDL